MIERGTWLALMEDGEAIAHAVVIDSAVVRDVPLDSGPTVERIRVKFEDAAEWTDWASMSEGGWELCNTPPFTLRIMEGHSSLAMDSETDRAVLAGVVQLWHDQEVERWAFRIKKLEARLAEVVDVANGKKHDC